MRKILAGFLATSMVVSMATMVSAATVTATSYTLTVPDTAVDGTPTANTGWTAGLWTADVTYNSLEMDLQDSANRSLGKIIVPLGDEKITPDPAAVAVTTGACTALEVEDTTVAALMNNKEFHDVNIDGVYYSGKLSASGATVTVSFTQGSITNLDHIAYKLNTTTGTRVLSGGAANTTDTIAVKVNATSNPSNTTSANITIGNSKETIETEKDGDLSNVPVSKILACYPDGTPIPLTEKGVGSDENLNDNGGVQSGKTVYFMIRDDADAQFDRLEDDLYWKLKITKSSNGKYVKAISDVTKIFSKDLYDANKSGVATVPGTGVNRHRYIKVELNEIYTDDEYKIGLDLRLSATQKAVDTNVVTKDSTEIKVKDFTFYMKNIVKDADNDWKVGIGGLMLNPVTNDWNEVTYYDEEGDVAFMKFFGDSDTGKFYAKLSTKWAHEDYAAYFNDQDAFYFEFTGSPNLSSTSRADLQIYNPFVDEDGNETIDPSTATVYQVVDGDLIDVTDSFTYGEGENGDGAFITRTRFLGSYIICEKPVEEAAGDADIDDLMPDDLEVPEDVTPDAGNNGGAKQPANTGRYL